MPEKEEGVDLVERRVIIVSDSLPYSYRQVLDDTPAAEADLPSGDGYEFELRSPSGISLRGSSVDSINKALHEASLGRTGHAFESLARDSHAAYLVGQQVGGEVLHVGKPVSFYPRGGEVDFSEDGDAARHLQEMYWAEKRSVPVFLPPDVARGHWAGYCHQRLWPLFHYVLWEDSIGGAQESEQWCAYVRANEAFCDAVLSVWRPGDIVWILDYHLLLLPAMLRARIADIVVALYIRSPFPSSELFRCLPQAKEVLSGMLGANLIGFQTYSYARHFVSSCTRILGFESTPRGVDNAGVPVEIVVQPVGIDPAKIAAQQASPAVRMRIAAFRELFAGKRVIVGLESVDQSKGVFHKLCAFERLLLMYPEWVSQITLVQFVLPGPDAGKRLDMKVADMVTKVNSQFGSLDYHPVHIYYQSIERDEYLALLTLADILLITSERDSVNTMILDYIACQRDLHGVPVISEFIGLTTILPPVFHVNPWDHAGTAASINEALNMPPEERASHCRSAARFVNSNTIQHWVSSFLHSLLRTINLLDIYLPTPLLTVDRLLGAFSAPTTHRRLLLLDYDGTLTPIRQTPSAAIPSAEVLRSLRLLTSDPKNYVYIISGRDQRTLEEWLGAIPRLGMSAEHGSFLRPITDLGEPSSWISTIDLDELTWQQDVAPIMEYYTERTPGSFVEFKTASIAWHYRLADPDFGSWQAKELQTHLEHAIASKFPVEIIPGKKNLEVRPRSSNKGEIIKSLLERHGPPGFILCAGDDKTDEDMFRVLAAEQPAPSPTGDGAGAAEWCFTCCIGSSSKKTLARNHVNTPEQMVSLLMRLCTLTADRVVGMTL